MEAILFVIIIFVIVAAIFCMKTIIDSSKENKELEEEIKKLKR